MFIPTWQKVKITENREGFVASTNISLTFFVLIDILLPSY